MAAGERLKLLMESQKGKPNGVAGLNESGKVPSGQLPAMDYVPTSRKVNGKALTADITLSAADTGAIPVAEKGATGGVATLDDSGKVPREQLPAMNYDPAGSAEAVQDNLNAHTNNKSNPHGVTAQQVGADPAGSASAVQGNLNTHTSNKNNPHGVTAAQVGTYEAEKIMASGIPAMFGLGAGAVPSDVLAYLGKYAQHWWRRRLLNVGTEYITPVVAGNSSFNDDPVTYILCTYRSYDPDYVYYNLEYSDGITYGNDGKPTGLAAPIKTVRLSNSNHATAAQVLKGKFIIQRLEDSDHPSLTEDKGIAFIPENATFDSAVNYKTTSYVYSDYISIDITAMPKKGEWEYLQSNEDDAYPHSGESGGYEYEYLGVPFKNAATSPKIAIGYYVGTGTSGEENKNSLTFNFSPSLLVIRANDPSIEYGGIFVKGQEDGIPDARRSGVTSTGHIYIEWNGNTVNWYSPDKFSSIQLNELNYIYYYTAIG